MSNRRRVDTAALDQIQAAVAETRRKVAAGLGLPDEPSPRGSSALFELLWDRHGTGPRCQHLDARPIQPSHLFPADGVWRCAPCQGRWAQTRPKLDPIEEFTCDGCRRFVSGLQATVVRQDFWVIVCGLCAACMAGAHAAGAKVVTR